MYSSQGFLRAQPEPERFCRRKADRVDCVVYDGSESVKTIDTSDIESDGCKTADGRIWFPRRPGRS